MSLLDLFLEDYNVNCHIVVYANELDKNGKKIISNEIDSVGRFFESGSMAQDTRTNTYNSNSELYIPCDIDEKQRVITNGYVVIDNVKYDIAKCQKADVFGEINFTRLWLK